MKQETKAKIKKALKWTGFAVLCAFASFGAVVACASIARNANGAEAQNTAETSATQRADLTPRRAITPRRALDPARYPMLDPDPNNVLFDSDFVREGYAVSNKDSTNQYIISANGSYSVFGVRGLPTGYYRLEYEYDGDPVYRGRAFLMDLNSYVNLTNPPDYVVDMEDVALKLDSYSNPYVSTFSVVNNGSMDDACNIVLSFNNTAHAKLSLLNFLAVPSSDVLTLPSDWSPSAWVSNRSIGGYPMLATTYTTSGNAGNSSLRVGWNNVMFRTANDDRVFTQLRVEYRWMWNGAKFRTRQGQEGIYDWDTGVADNYLLFPYRVDYFDRLANQWFQVAEQDYQWGTESYAIITDKMKWINERYRTLYFVDYPSNPQFVTISEYTTDLWVTTNPLPIVMRYGLTFGDWFGLGSGWASPTITDVGTGDAIGVIRSAFDGLLPILNIAILPNITLGLLLFLPMIGGIIILIIKAVNK